MTQQTPLDRGEISARPDHVFPTLTPAQIARALSACARARLAGSSNIKRVASAVGEGSIAISFVHRVLHE